MTFNTPQFILFFTACLLVYYRLPDRLRRYFLLAASAVFYVLALPAGWGYLALLAGTTALCYFAARFMARTENDKARRTVLTVSLLVLFGLLGVFKYANFFLALAGSSTSLNWLVPVGLSFYTFQAAGYLIDVHNRSIEPERDGTVLALYLCFFPQILSGPINRAKSMLPQFHATHDFDYHTVICGAQRFLTGLFKKVVLADGLAVIVDGVYGALPDYTGLTLLIAVLFYAIQLYFDFSGYSDMAIAAAQMLGFTMRENFAAPYFATNMSGFWKRWHMSLTGWFTDYLFTPLVWSRWVNKLAFGKDWNEHKPHFAVNILIVFTLSGLWHGAGITFVVWGLLNGLLRVAEEGLHKLRAPKKKGQPKLLVLCKRVCVFLLFAVTLVFFRAPDLASAGYVFRSLPLIEPVSVVVAQLWHLASNGIAISGTYMMFFWGVLALGLVLGVLLDVKVDRALTTKGAQPLLNPVGTFGRKTRWAIYWFMGFSAMLFYFIGLTGQRGASSFIYIGF